MISPKLSLAGTEVPRIGLGTNRLTNTPAHVDLVKTAVAAGVGYIDTAQLGHVIPSAAASPHDQPAHGLPQDLKRQMSGVLTRQLLPTPSLPNSPGKSH